MKELVKDWNRIESALEAVWNGNGKPKGAVWKKLATPLWERQRKVEDSLAPMLLEWAENNGCGEYRDGSGRLGLLCWLPEKDCYKKIVDYSGLKAPWHRIRNLLLLGGWLVRGEKVRKQQEENADKFVRSMSDDEFTKYMSGFCTASTEGKNTWKFFWELRLTYLKERIAQHRKADIGNETAAMLAALSVT